MALTVEDEEVYLDRFFESYSTIYRRIKDVYPNLPSLMYYFTDGLFQTSRKDEEKESDTWYSYYDFVLIMRWRNGLSRNAHQYFVDHESEIRDMIGTINYYADKFASYDPEVRKKVDSLIEKTVDASDQEDGDYNVSDDVFGGNEDELLLADICDLRDAISFSNRYKMNYVQTSAIIHQLLTDSSLIKDILHDAKEVQVENKDDYKKINKYWKNLCEHLGILAKCFEPKGGTCSDYSIMVNDEIFKDNNYDFLSKFNDLIYHKDKEMENCKNVV